MTDAPDVPADAPTLGDCSNADALTIIATLVDQAFDADRPQPIDYVMVLADELEARGLQPDELAILDYSAPMVGAAGGSSG